MRAFSLSAVLTTVMATTVTACDLCAIYSAAQSRGEIGKGAFAGVAEQFTHFGTVQVDGVEVPNAAGQYLNSSISQVYAGYNFTERVGVQLNLPGIYRSYKRPDGLGGIDHGNVSGIGDLSLLGSFMPVSHDKMNATFRWTVSGGVKFPTGNADRLKEEFNEVEEPVGPASGIHGHDLALGSGSYDGLVGTALFGRWKKLFLAANVQYAIRSEGEFDYRYANDLTWAGGPGAYVLVSENHTLSVQVVVSGEHKGLDTFRGAPAQDTGMTAIYLGPVINFTWRENLSAFVGFGLPVSIQNTALQTVPDYRIGAGVAWHF